MKEVPHFRLIRKKSSISDEFDDMKIEKRRQKGTRKLLSCTSNQYLQNLFDRTKILISTRIHKHTHTNLQ